MTKLFLKTILLCGTAILFINSSLISPLPDLPLLPEGWFTAGDKPISYEMGITTQSTQQGGKSATIKSIDKSIDGFGTLMQTCSPDKFAGKRVRLTGFLKTENVAEWASLWFRVDVDTVFVSFDNMYDGETDRSIKGTTDWKKYEIVLDVPLNATLIAYGALLAGTGQLWFDSLAFETVETTVATTGITNPNKIQNAKQPSGLGPEPVNLDFEK